MQALGQTLQQYHIKNKGINNKLLIEILFCLSKVLPLVMDLLNNLNAEVSQLTSFKRVL